MAQLPYYRLADWRPEAGPLEDWLAAFAEAGWVPEFPPPYEGPWVSVGARPEVMRWSMVRAGTFADRWADQRAASSPSVWEWAPTESNSPSTSTTWT